MLSPLARAACQHDDQHWAILPLPRHLMRMYGTRVAASSVACTCKTSAVASVRKKSSPWHADWQCNCDKELQFAYGVQGGLLYHDVEGADSGALELPNKAEYLPPRELAASGSGEGAALLGGKPPAGGGNAGGGASPVISLKAHAGGAAPNAARWPPGAPGADDVKLKLPLV